MSNSDPRSSYLQSLVPSESNPQNDRRKLLLVFIHGFMGNETSFRSFPAHLHNLLTLFLAETHVVYTKIYPRYPSKNHITTARDDFSRWLEPHEDDLTDVVLLGHSMGGLLCAEVAIMPPPAPANRALKHRILGTINFDVPFLGLDAGVVKSGLASLWKSDDPPEDKYQLAQNASGTSSGGDSSVVNPPARQDTLWSASDPNFNPSFQNDVELPVRKGWRNAWHFVNKHSDDLSTATKKMLLAHWEFGVAMANYSELHARYARVRALGEEDANVRRSVGRTASTPQRVRFINYYTASHGKSSASKSSDAQKVKRGQSDLSVNHAENSPRISVEAQSESRFQTQRPGLPTNTTDEDLNAAAETLILGTHPDDSSSSATATSSRAGSGLLSPTLSQTDSLLPSIPELPTAPAPLDLSYIEDRKLRAQVEKEHARAVKSYDRAVKDRDKTLRDRAKLEQKQSRRLSKQAEKEDKKRAREAKAEIKEQQQAKIPESEMSHSQREELRLAAERERMEDEGRRMRGEKTLAEQRREEAQAQQQQQQQQQRKRSSSPMQDGEFISAELAPALERLSPTPSSHNSDSPPPPPPRRPPPLPARSSSSLPVTTTSSTSLLPSSSSSSINPSALTPTTTNTTTNTTPTPPKDRMFCRLPPKDSSGERDPCWVRIFMHDVDEVGAHCGLFYVDERYERLVGDVGARVEGWVLGSA